MDHYVKVDVHFHMPPGESPTGVLLHQVLHQVLTLQRSITELGGIVMAQIDDVKAELDAQSAKLDSIGAKVDEIAGEATTINQEVQDLIALVQSGGQATDLTEVLSKLQALGTKTDSLADKVNAVDAQLDAIPPKP